MWKGSQRPSQKKKKNKATDKRLQLKRMHPDTRMQYQVNMGDKKWLKIDDQGNAYPIFIDRHKLNHELGIQTRDLRVLDPKFSTNYPSAILCRDNAIVVNLLHIRAILTTHYVLVVNPSNQDSETSSFVRELENRLREQDMRASLSFPVLSQAGKEKEKHKENGSQPRDAHDVTNAYFSQSDNGEMVSSDDDLTREQLTGKSGILPFELKALEVCLERICGILENEVSQLEGTAYPAGHDLTKQVTNQNLQRVRSAKSKNGQLKAKVETVKGILEKLLEDDEDMKAMNLTAKQQTHRTLYNSTENVVSLGNYEQNIQNRGAPIMSPRSISSSSSSSVDEDMQEVEMLLEAYFLQLNNTFNRLQALNEYIDIAEDLISIEQDKHRNRLLQLELIITVGALALNFIAAVAGLFGMNLDNKIANDTPVPFLTVVGVTFVIASFVFVGILGFCRIKGLLAF